MALHRVAVELRADVPGAHRPARRRSRRAHPARDRARAEEPRADGPLDGRHRHRAGRLPAAALRQDRPRPLPALRPPGRLGGARPRGRHPARRGGRRPRAGRLPPAGAARRPGRRPAGPAGRPRLRADPGGGRRGSAVPAPGPGSGRPRDDPRDPRPPRPPPGHPDAPGRLLRAGLSRGRRPGRGGDPAGRPPGRGTPPRGAVRLSGLRDDARAASAPALLLQPSARRVFRVQGVRQPPALRRGARDPGPRHLARRRRRRALAAPVR